MEKMIDAVIWDMGGVLLRTEDPIPRLKLAERLGITAEELYTTVFMSETAEFAMIGKIKEDLHWDFIRRKFDLSATQLEEFQSVFWSGDRVDEKLVDYINSLRPGVQTALLSNAWSEARNIITSRFRMLHAFDVIVFSAEIGLAKPDRRIFHYVLKKLGLPADRTVFIDDIKGNVDGARSLGMKGIVFTGRDQTVEELVRLNVTGHS